MSTVAVLLACSIGLAAAQSPTQVQPNVTICNWAGLRSGIIRDTIYLDGGSLWWQSAIDTDGQPVLTNDGGVDGLMFSLNLSYAFDTTTFNKTTSLLQALSKTGGTAGNNIAPNYVDGALLANDGAFQLFGGLLRLTDAYTPPDAQAVLGYEAYQYGPERTTWSRGFIQSNLPDEMTRYVTHGAAVSVPSENLAFYFSGLRGANWGPITQSTRDWYPANTLISADMSTMRSTQWSNSSLPNNVPSRAGAELVWIPVGGRGALVAIGGVTAVESLLSAGLNETQSSDVEEDAPAFMTSLPVYDIVSETWYMQNTTGDGPGRLTEFCSVVAPAKDFSSFNIYIYGGYDGLNSTSLPSDSVWILSIPSFTWIRAYPGLAAHGRRGHRCERIYPDQMLVIGGVNPNAQRCIEGGPIQVFNLNTLKFQNLYDPREWDEYAVPDVVTAAIGGNGQGGATPPTRLSGKALSSLFENPYTRATPTYYPYPAASGNPGQNTVPTLIPTPRSGGLAKWVIPVGVVIGVTVLFLCLAGLFVFYRRRKSRGVKSVADSDAGGRNSNPILNWVNGMPPYSKTVPPSSTDDDNETFVSSPRMGALEAGGQQRYEMETVERENPIVEMPTPYNLQEHPNYPRSKDFAPVGLATSTSSSGGGNNGVPLSSRPSVYSRPSDSSPLNLHQSGLDSHPHSPASISPQSPRPLQMALMHSHSLSGTSGTSATGGGNGGIGTRNAPSPFTLPPHSPEDVGSSTGMPSPTGSPDLRGSGPGPHPTAVGGATDRPAHHRNVSSLSQLPSPAELRAEGEEDLTRNQLLLERLQQQQREERGEGERSLGALEGLALGNQTTTATTAATTTTNVKKVEGKQSSFGEVFYEGVGGGGGSGSGAAK